MTTTNIIAACTIGIAAMSAASRALEPPSRPEEVRGEGTLKVQPAVGIQMGRQFVRFEQSTLADILKAAGRGLIAHHGDASGSEYFLCYTKPTGPLSFRVWVISNGEMGGPAHSVTEIVAHRVEAATAANEECPPLPRHLQPVALDRGIWIGTTRDQLRRKFGPESAARDDGWLVYNFLGALPGRIGGERVSWDVTNTLEARVRNGRVDALRASRVTSN